MTKTAEESLTGRSFGDHLNEVLWLRSNRRHGVRAGAELKQGGRHLFADLRPRTMSQDVGIIEAP